LTTPLPVEIVKGERTEHKHLESPEERLKKFSRKDVVKSAKKREV